MRSLQDALGVLVGRVLGGGALLRLGLLDRPGVAILLGLELVPRRVLARALAPDLGELALCSRSKSSILPQHRAGLGL
ncbi:hypothetical protein CTI14_48215, partial [Methylobacterium radiotolerans]